jgi:hypothetical protein
LAKSESCNDLDFTNFLSNQSNKKIDVDAIEPYIGDEEVKTK